MLRRNLIAVAAGLLLLSGCGSSVATAYRSHLPVEPGAAAAASGELVITGAGFDLHTAGKVSSATFDGAWAGVLATLNRYLEVGVLTPLRSGGPAGDLAPLFTAEAGGRVASPGPDRAAFIDEGLPPVTDIRKDAAVATLSALAGRDGSISVVTARLDLRLRAALDGSPLTVVRTGELVLMPEGGSWRIDAYDLRVSRDSVGGPPTTARSS